MNTTVQIVPTQPGKFQPLPVLVRYKISKEYPDYVAEQLAVDDVDHFVVLTKAQYKSVTKGSLVDNILLVIFGLALVLVPYFAFMKEKAKIEQKDKN